jgi:hypothetical protein
LCAEISAVQLTDSKPPRLALEDSARRASFHNASIMKMRRPRDRE